MTAKEYIDRNLKGFESDSFIKKRIEYFKNKFNIKIAIETGSFIGGTTKVLSTMFDWVFTCELSAENFKKSKDYLKDVDNVSVINRSSPEFLNLLLPEIGQPQNLLFYLDAHWEKACPLLDELKAIADNKIKPVIIIHDWKVPNRPDLGYDSYNGQDFTFDWIEKSIYAIYGLDKYAYHYNDEAEGARRGVIYIYPTE